MYRFEKERKKTSENSQITRRKRITASFSCDDTLARKASNRGFCMPGTSNPSTSSALSNHQPLDRFHPNRFISTSLNRLIRTILPKVPLWSALLGFPPYKDPKVPYTSSSLDLPFSSTLPTPSPPLPFP